MERILGFGCTEKSARGQIAAQSETHKGGFLGEGGPPQKRSRYLGHLQGPSSLEHRG